MSDQFPKDENSAKADFEVSPESGSGLEAANFRVKPPEQFLGGGGPKPADQAVVDGQPIQKQDAVAEARAKAERQLAEWKFPDDIPLHNRLAEGIKERRKLFKEGKFQPVDWPEEGEALPVNKVVSSEVVARKIPLEQEPRSEEESVSTPPVVVADELDNSPPEITKEDQPTPAVKEGMTRLYRGEALGGRSMPSVSFRQGRWFTNSVDGAQQIAKERVVFQGGIPQVSYVDVPHEDAEKFVGKKHDVAALPGSYLLPLEVATSKAVLKQALQHEAQSDTTPPVVAVAETLPKPPSSPAIETTSVQTIESPKPEAEKTITARAPTEQSLGGGGPTNMEGKTEIQVPPQETLKPENQSLEITETSWLGRLRDRFNRVFRKEQDKEPLIGGPKIAVDIFFSPHGSAKDWQKLPEKFKNCDIYIPEAGQNSREYLDILKGLSSGKIRLEDIERFTDETEKNSVTRERMKLLARMISNSKKPIALIDLPENRQSIENTLNTSQGIKFGDFSQTLESLRKNFLDLNDSEREREEYMVTQLGPQVEAILKANPNLRRKEEIRVLLSLGAVHTPLYHSLKKENAQTTREFSNNPFIYSFSGEIIRRHAFGRPVDDQLLGRALTEILLDGAFGAVYQKITENDSEKIMRLERGLILPFSQVELKNIFDGASNLNEWAGNFVSELSKKGLRISNSK